MNYQTALITGASAGIGQTIARHLAKHQVKLVLVARRLDRLESLAQELSSQTECHVLPIDLSQPQQIEEGWQSLHTTAADFCPIDILINCAGMALGLGKAQETDWADWQTMIAVNVAAVTKLTQLCLPSMIERDRGHIVNIGSIAGSYPYPGGNVYGASKSFLKQFTLNLKADLAGTAVRATNIEPGMVSGSEFSLVRFKGDEERAAQVYAGVDALTTEDIADAALWALSAPAHVNINRIEMMPTSQGPARSNYVRKDTSKP